MKKLWIRFRNKKLLRNSKLKKCKRPRQPNLKLLLINKPKMLQQILRKLLKKWSNKLNSNKRHPTRKSRSPNRQKMPRLRGKQLRMR